MIVIDGRGLIQSLSAAAERMFGFAAEEACGQNVRILMPSLHSESHDGYVDGHGGRLWVKPNSEGGAVFCLTLPAVRQMAPGDPYSRATGR
jgi:PAS domain S-box-containing protein